MRPNLDKFAKTVQAVHGIGGSNALVPYMGLKSALRGEVKEEKMSKTHETELIERLGFVPKEKTEGVFVKRYACGYAIEIDFEKETINYGKHIAYGSKTTQNFSQAENLVVLECVDRLLEKGYSPKDIFLEKIFPSGHGHSGRLDILVEKEKKAFLMIECKTWGKEYDRESEKIQNNGGQLFTYFQNDTNTNYLMLYTSRLSKKTVEYKCEIITIEDHYRTAGNVEDAYNRWNKIINKNGIFDDWVEPYKFQGKLLAKKDLTPLTDEDSGKLFNAFASILRKHTVSDKPNAFNKIFNLFLAKIYDEKKRDNDVLDFQWKEGTDTAVDFEVRLINLHTEGLHEFLRKEMAGIYDEDFEGYKNLEELYKKKKHRLKIDKILDIKEVFDDDSFEDNFRVLKEVVQLLEKYQIRYPRRQRHLSDFFERLLTTGLKQESGQYFTPVPITHFIVCSLPIKEMIERAVNSTSETLPAMIDYAAGSGHFITDILETYQDIIQNLDTSNYYPEAIKKVNSWRSDPYSWAATYIYGIEKDYRLVKVAKVGCYFYGDGLAQIFHADGLDNFAHSRSYDGLLKKNANAPRFDIVASNPPYSINGFRGDLRNKTPNEDFALYKQLTDKSSEIEGLFVERTAQLLKAGGVAGIILPSSILSNTGIYTKAREILLLHFDIIGITEFGKNTFMATKTNTVVLFLRRKDDAHIAQLKETIDAVFDGLKDCTVNGIEKAVSLYINHVWAGLSLSDYKSLIQKKPCEATKAHALYKEYRPREWMLDDFLQGDTSPARLEYAEKKLKELEDAFWTRTINLEKEKFLYFVIAYKQTVVLVKRGDKDAEKRFLGYEFSNRRGNEWIHSIQRGKTIGECTKLFDETRFDNPEKASTYIQKAFNGDYDFPVDESLKDNVSRVCLVDMLNFERAGFEKNIVLAVKKKASNNRIGETDNLISIDEIAEIQKGTALTKEKTREGTIPVIAGGKEPAYFHNTANRNGNIITVSASGAYSGFVNYFEIPIFASDCNTIQSKDEDGFPTKLIYLFLKSIQKTIYELQKGQAQPHVYAKDLAQIQIPNLPKEIQQKIVAEIEVLEKEEAATKENIENGKKQIENICLQLYSNYDKEKIINLAKTNPSKTEIAGLDLNTSISFIDMPSVSNDGYIMHKIDKLYSEVKKGSYTYFCEGDIIIAKITPCMENGKCALATNLTNGLALGSSEFHVFRANNDKVDTKYLFLLLNRKPIRVEAERNMTGASGHRRVPISFYENLQLPLPPLPEQRKVVAEIEKIEAEIQDMQKALERLSHQKEAVLKTHL